ncbi:hypothetical protein ACEZ3G_01795 [Maribacter algicola]|uniref:Uncharacterized protein n=1 Tax=Meishania litoralis TaxID=3434685 RepID=A0ACC7LJR4_9FLAO
MKNYVIASLIMCFGLLAGCSKNSTDTEKEIPVDKSANLLGTGDSAADILSNDRFDKLLIEVGHVAGFKPTPSTMDAFVNFIKRYTFKQNIEIVYNELESPGEETLTLQEIADLESDNRTVYNSGNTLAMYIYFADAPSDDDDENEELVTLGAVYRNTSMVIHEVTVRELAGQSPIISNADVEIATLNHEFGHLFGLVNLGSPSVNDHEGTTLDNNGNEIGNNHCTVEGCLMRAELQLGTSGKTAPSAKNIDPVGPHSSCSLSGSSVLQMLQNKASKGAVAAPGLDNECILDLQANGGR